MLIRNKQKIVFNKGANACVRVEGDFSESFVIGMGVRQGCVMPQWVFNIF